MKVLSPLKDANLERRMFQRRVRFGVAVMLALAFLLLARLVYLQVLNHEHFTTLSQENRLKIMPIAPTEG